MPAPANTGTNSGSTNKLVVQKLAKRHARTKKEREESKGGKAGHPGRFHGAILEFLQQHVDDYLALPSRSDGGRNTALAVFWNTVHGAFWERFTVDDARGTMPASDDADDAAVIASMNEVSMLAIPVKRKTYWIKGYKKLVPSQMQRARCQGRLD